MSASATHAAATTEVKTPETINLQELLSVCYDLSEHAGRSIRRIFDSGHLGAIDKDPASASGEAAAAANATSVANSGGIDFGTISDPQTLADLESQRIIIGNLQRIYGPGLTIVGEEGELENATGDHTLVREARKDVLAAEAFPKDLLQLETKDLTLWVDRTSRSRSLAGIDRGEDQGPACVGTLVSLRCLCLSCISSSAGWHERIHAVSERVHKWRCICENARWLRLGSDSSLLSSPVPPAASSTTSPF